VLTATTYRARAGGVLPCCGECERALLLARAKLQAWRAKNPEKDLAIARKRRVKSPEYAKLHSRKFRAANIEKTRAYHREYNRTHSQKYADWRREYMGAWHEKNHMAGREYAARRRAATIHRLPRWADRAAIKEFYKNCPPGMVVDHIIPLRGKTVSGLHVLSNLQYLSDHDNAVKYNKLPEALRA
jgi:hypothetical protein